MKIGILGAGIAGLSVAYELHQKDCTSMQIYEASDQVGGLARSFKWHGFDCDLAPHRLFVDDKEILDELTALVPMHKLRRQSEIFIRGKWIQDPVNAVEVILKFFPKQSLRIVWYYLFREKHPELNFESLVLNQFGKGLNEFFFKPYSEKLFGVPADQISPVWGRRKIRVGGIKDIIKRKSRLYFKEFYYPKQNGYGAICTALHQQISDAVSLNTRLIDIRKDTTSEGYTCSFKKGDKEFEEHFDVIISSLPITLVMQMLGKMLKLNFRPAILTYLLIDKPKITNNHWYYLADSDYKINRVAEFKNFAFQDAPVDKTVLCCEVTNSDGYSVERVIDELVRINVIKSQDVLDSKVIKIPEAYPIYDLDYENQMLEITQFSEEHPNLFFIGRNAQFLHQDVDEIFASGKKIAEKILTHIIKEEVKIFQ